MKAERITFRGIDGWNRPVFQSIDFPKNFFGLTDMLFDFDSTEAQVLSRIKPASLLFFGSKFNCEPMGTPAPGLIILSQEEAEIIKQQDKEETPCWKI